MKPILESIKHRKKTLIRSAVFGILLGLVCHLVPPDYHQACSAFTGAISLSCTGR